MPKTFDSLQLKAINATGGYFLVLASPGCGKTDILAERIARAIQCGVPASQMLCLTFTNRAARGMRERIALQTPDNTDDLFVGNIHRFCSRFLQQNYILPESTAIADDDDVAELLLSLDSQAFAQKKNLKLVQDLACYFSQRQLHHPDSAIFVPSPDAESLFQTALSYGMAMDSIPTDFPAARYAVQYSLLKKQLGLVDFNDLLLLTYDALLNDVDHAFPRYPWIQIDEVQDLNPLQMAIVDQLSLPDDPNFSVMYLGDEQQSIFSFLGASISQVELLRQRCQGNILSLTNNYRSPRYLLDVFNTYAVNQLHVLPDLLPQPQYDIPKDKLDLIVAQSPTTEDELNRLPAMARHYLSFSGERLAFLVPRNDDADAVSSVLQRAGIPHFKISGADMFRSVSFKSVSAVVSVVVSEWNNQAWARLVSGLGASSSLSLARQLADRVVKAGLSFRDLLRPTPYAQQFLSLFDSDSEIVFFDTETTGTSVLEDDIVQIAAFKVQNGQRLPDSDFVVFLHTDRPIPQMIGDIVNPIIEAYAVNPHLQRADGLQQFLDYVGDRPLLGHNVNYDYQILRNNVRRSLGRDVAFPTFDSLHLARTILPAQKSYKLGNLIKSFGLEGQNSHLADDDVAATLSLVQLCVSKQRNLVSAQKQLLADPSVRKVVSRLQPLATLLLHVDELKCLDANSTGSRMSEVVALIHSSLVDSFHLPPLGPKFDAFLRYVASEWEPADEKVTLADRLFTHDSDMASSLNEGDLVSTDGVMSDRVFVMTVHKAKGLEFDNVVVTSAHNQMYPFFWASRDVANPNTPQSRLIEAQLEVAESARKFYVAISRAKRRLCISFPLLDKRHAPVDVTQFMASIRHFFVG